MTSCECVCVFVWRICVRIECFDHINLHRFTYYLALKSLLLFAHDENSRPNGQTTRVFVCACIITISFYLRKQSRSTSAVMRCALFTLPKGQSTLTHTQTWCGVWWECPERHLFTSTCGHPSELLMPTLSRWRRPSPPNRNTEPQTARTYMNYWNYFTIYISKNASSDFDSSSVWRSQACCMHHSIASQPNANRNPYVNKMFSNKFESNWLVFCHDWRTVDGRQDFIHQFCEHSFAALSHLTDCGWLLQLQLLLLNPLSASSSVVDDVSLFS